MPALKYFAYKVATTKGVEHFNWLEALREYIKEKSEDELVKELIRINADNELKAILEAGAKGKLYYEIQKKLRGG